MGRTLRKIGSLLRSGGVLALFLSGGILPESDFGATVTVCLSALSMILVGHAVCRLCGEREDEYEG